MYVFILKMPQIDKILFLPQVLGSFIFMFFSFIFLIKFAGLLLASTYKVRNKLIYGFMGVNSIVTKLINSYFFNYGKDINLSLKIKSLFFLILFL